MKYEDLEQTTEFERNMRKTPFLKLFPHWWGQNDPLLKAIGDEVERIKALAIFGLLSATMKPPVLLWQSSLVHDKYNVNQDINQLPAVIEIEPTLYKTWGDITLTNNTEDDIDGLEITFDGKNGFAINQLISQGDVIYINLTENKVKINHHTIKPQKIGDGMPYFITSAKNNQYVEGTPLNNEIIKLKINTDSALEDTIVSETVNVTEKMEKWDVHGDASRYNQQGADPWIALGKGRIGYELDFSNITEISFICKADIPNNETCTLDCFADNENIGPITVSNSFEYYVINTKEVETSETVISIPDGEKNTFTITKELIGIGKLEFENTENVTIYINEIKYKTESKYKSQCDINVDINMNDAVFINEQNIEVTGLELVPIERIELYANYDFEYNKQRNGWQKVYQKKYDSKTNVIYDMVTTHFITKEFYVDVWFKTLQYPYRVGFPCYQAAESDSMFHVNNRLDTYGETLGLERRLYRTDIEEDEYAKTFPVYYPFDIEQDYWYYRRLASEYTWNDLAINNVDLEDTNGDALITLHSINPFCEDFVVHARTRYPIDKEFTDVNEYYPCLIKQEATKDLVAQSEYNNIINLLSHNDYSAIITLNNNSDNNDVRYKVLDKYIKDNAEKNIVVDKNNLTTEQEEEIDALTVDHRLYIDSSAHISKELTMFFDLNDLPEDINIDDITVTVEAESTDNKKNKFSTDKTGLIIPSLDSSEEDTFIPLTADKSYQLAKQSITYTIDDKNSLQQIISGVDENIMQQATIGAFECKLGEYMRIPFTLTENEIEVDDITDVWVTYNKTKVVARIEYEDEQQYIYVRVPKIKDITTININCECEKHKPFTIDIGVAPKNQPNEGEEDDGTYPKIYGPLAEDGESSTMEYTKEWHTSDIRNILQHQGIYFRNVFINTDEQSSTTIILYNVRLDIHYSKKKSDINLNTYINVKDAVKPHVGIYELSVKNIGDKPLKTSIDIITPPNITLSKNYIDVDLNIEGKIEESINITPEYPIIDGVYDILTICDDVIKRDSISVFAEGLIQTSVTLKPHSGKYNENITLYAEVNTVDGSVINGNGSEIQFYINGFAVGEPVAVYDNKAKTTITPGNYNFTGTGTLKLEARYLGSTKYASSRGSNTIFISKNNTRITLNAPEKAIYQGIYRATAIVEYYDGKKYKPVNDGYVTFYANDEIIGTNTSSDYNNGTFITSIDKLNNPPGDYILKARYEGSNSFASTEATQQFEIIGGDVDVLVFDENAKPYDNIHLKAKVVDKNNKPVLAGYVDFVCEELDVHFQNIELQNGIGSTPYFNINVPIENDDTTEIINFTVIYHGEENDEQTIYNEGEGIGSIIIRKSEAIIECASLYQASQYEPLGFIVKVKDSQTNEYINEGTITITLPSQNNLTLSGRVENGIVRLVHNLINFTAKEWQELTKWSFSTNNDNSKGQIDIINNTDIPEYDGIYNPENLYKIYDGDYTDITLVDFILSANGEYLEYIGHKDDTLEETEKDVHEYIFIGDDGCLYAQTDIDELRQYTTGLQDLKISFVSDGGYKTKTIIAENSLNIEPQTVDLDIHSYDLSYTDNDRITCYVTKYNHEEANSPINEGNVQFIFDNKLIDTIKVNNGLAILPNNSLINVPSGNHLLEVSYIKDNKSSTHSYSFFNLRQSVPTISLDIDRVIRNKNSQITVKINSAQNLDIPLNGLISLYLNDEKIGEQYLYGNENLTGIVDYEGHITNDMIIDVPHVIFNYIMPHDVDIEGKYTLKAIYQGNEFFTASEPAIRQIKEEPSIVNITSEDVNIDNIIDVAVGEECSIDFLINCSDDTISEGILYLIGENDNIHDNVVNNTATLTWIPQEVKEYSFELKYDNDDIHYRTKSQVIRFNSINSLDTIHIPNERHKTLKQALMCLTTNGTIYIDDDIEINKSFTINKDCNIIGRNDASITNINDENIEITNNSNTHIDNIHFISDEHIIQIINNNYLVINRSILDNNIHLHNNQDLMAQRNFIYGMCSGSTSDLNNNWWGSNNPPYDVDTYIIIKVEPVNKPAVISEDVDIVGMMIGSNGREYILPEANFTFGADTGYFSTDFGKTVNHQAKTTYLDAEKEGQVYFTVDNQTTTCDIYSYDRKTEVIIDDIDELPINYQIPIRAKVQSAADTFYEFDKKNNITKSTTVINEGHILFYLDDQQIGYSPVINGEAETIVFLTQKYYNNQQNYTLKAIYQPNNYYFSSENSIPIVVTNNDNTCYVSSSGNDNDDGSFAHPFNTIQYAIESMNNHGNIYLLDEYIKEANIDVTKNINLKSFKNNSKFISLDGDVIFNIPREVTLSIKGCDFSNNNTDIIFHNDGVLNIDKCILYKNKKVFDGYGDINAIYSAIVDNEIIADTINPSWFMYCWFGQNNPDINVDNYVQMSKKASKDTLYIGTLAHITGLLDKYRSGVLTYKLEKPLPLRIAKFATTYGSMKPIKDYTYNNQSSSLLNTQEDNNTKQYIISIPDNTNYIEHKIILKCLVTDVHDIPATGIINMHIYNYGTDIVKDVTLQDGEGILEIDRLSEGTYTLQCTYDSNNDISQTYTATSNFVVKKPDIIVKKFNILGTDNLYNTTLDIELEDTFGEKINDETIIISIDNNIIDTVNVKNGVIFKKILYNKLKQGQYKLSIANIDNQSKYDNFIADKNLYVSKKDVQIIFPYTMFEVDVRNNIYIKILDDENINVEGGYIDVELDNIKIVSNAEVTNGTITINNFMIDEVGQHSIVIHYSGSPNYYNEQVFINNYLSVGIFNVIFDIDPNEYLYADIGQPFNFSTMIRDVANQSVNQGYVNLYIDDILLNENPIYVNDGKISIQTDLPVNISAGIYSFKIEYIDSSDRYLDTFLFTFLEVGKIRTEINTNVIYGAPGQKTTLDYQIFTTYGNAKSGTLIAKYDNNIIGQSAVTDSINNTMTITVPFIPDTEDYIVNFEYHDEDKYADSSKDVRLIIRKNNVNIEPSHTWYYPNKNFHFIATILDKDGNRVNAGKAALYIDNVKETESQDVINGQFTVPLIFNKARKYPMSIVYEGNNYYEQTNYDFTFKIDSIDIDDISLKDDNEKYPLYYIQDGILHSLPYQLIESELVFSTLDDYNVKDGIIDIEIDNNTIASYYIAESNKYIKFNIDNLSKGNHDLKIKYYGSSLFRDYEKTIPLIIQSKQVTMRINDGATIIAHNHQDAIDINTLTHKPQENSEQELEPIPITGILRYYIGLPIYKVDATNNSVIEDYDYRFIGVEQVNNTSHHEYSYILPTHLLEYAIDQHETYYKIKVEFIGNDEYDETSSVVDLHIEKDDCNLEIIHDSEYIDVQYRDTININFNIDAQGSPLVNIYIDDDLIGSVIAKNGAGKLSYKLGNRYTVKNGNDDYYTIRASFDGSAVDKQAEDTAKLRVHPLTPNMDIDDKEVFYGGILKLNNMIYDDDGTTITDGPNGINELSYRLEDDENTYTYPINIPASIHIPETNKETLVLHVTYNTTNSNYMIFEEDININLQPNDVILDIEAPDEIYRGQEYNIYVKAQSETTDLPINLTFNESYEIEDGHATIPIMLPATEPYEEVHNFSITSPGNQYFNPINKTIPIKIINKNRITINTEADESATNAHTLEKAIDLVAEYGTIEVINPPENQQITLEKSINIEGNVEVENWSITNNAHEVTITGLTFNNSTKSAIISNDDILIGECTFHNGQTSAVYINGGATIYQCTFTNNNAQDGAGVYISNRNYRTIIDECVFSYNNVSGNGSCIYSNKGNDVEISNSQFNNNNGTLGVTSSICVNGNIYISSNTFFNNIYECEIYLLNGTLSAEENLFDGSIQSIKGYNGKIDADFNYWGYNDISYIENNNSDLILINNWLISSRKDYSKKINGETVDIVVGLIEQYQNRLEKEITTISPIQATFPVTIGANTFNLNDEISTNPSAVLKIGQQELR